MLPTLKCLLSLLFALYCFNVFAGEYDSYYRDLRSSNGQYATESNVSELEEQTPQYNESKSNPTDAQDSEYSDMFFNYGGTLTNSCEVNTYQETRTLECNENTYYSYTPESFTQYKSLDRIEWNLINYFEPRSAYYCGVTDQTYDVLSICNNECTDTTSTILSQSCTYGLYDSNLNKCILDYSCPPGYTEQGGVCTKTTAYTPDCTRNDGACPAGFDIISGVCVDESAAAKTCRAGYKEDTGSFCLFYYTAQVDPDGSKVCAFNKNMGYELDGELCVLHDSYNYQCNPGYTLYGTVCRNTAQIIDPVESCPSGMTDKGDYCERSYSNTGYCPLGYTESGGNCVLSVTDVVYGGTSGSYSCPSGYVKKLYTYRCPLSLSPLDWSDWKWGSFSCPSGWGQAGTGQCIHIIPLSYTCNSGYTPIGTQCVKRVQKINENCECPSGSTLIDGSCIKVQTSEKTYCPSGMTNDTVNGRCVMNPTPVYVCPPGYSKIDNNTCRKTALCTSTTIEDELQRYDAVFNYSLDPESLDPLVGCLFSSYTCTNTQSTCTSKDVYGICTDYESICYMYERNVDCQRPIENVSRDCAYQITSNVVN
jgi:hypothetical protein